MNLDELVQSIRQLSTDKEVQGLSHWMLEWKTSDADIAGLRYTVEKYFGTVWIDSEDIHNAAYELWQTFLKLVVDRVDGMTVNERLYHFSLFDAYDAVSEARRAELLAKLR